MWLWTWISDILASLGLKNKEGVITFLGLDNAGKSTLLHLLKYDRVAILAPTTGKHDTELTIGNLTLRTNDLGGHYEARVLWENYGRISNAIVFLIDVADFKPLDPNTDQAFQRYGVENRFQEAVQEFRNVLNHEAMKDKPILILGNKIDLPGALDEDTLSNELGITHLRTGKGQVPLEGVRPLELFMCAITYRQGYGEGFRWLSQYI